ncbi:MAG: GMC oxidoreductase, partial [Chloroflexota bacterium]|nr:GMC oxidoreductase [Chloroflexota bacterium]
RNGEAWGGGVLFDLNTALPIDLAILGRSLAPAPFGPDHKQWMRTATQPLGVMSMVQEIPHEDSRVTLDPTVKDQYGMPVARLRGRSHPASAEATAYVADRAREWLGAAGAHSVDVFDRPGGFHGNEHSAGTARMGDDPRYSATDPEGRLWGSPNIYVADASLHPTNGGFNPALTAMACALRVASKLASR